MPRWPKPPEGSWTEHFDLGTEPMNYEDSISQEFFELEREAVFKRAWLNVGPGRAAAAHGELLHQGARRRQDVRRRGEGEGRRGPCLLQHVPAPREQAGLERLPEGGDERHHAPVRLQVPRLALRPRRRVLVRPAGAGVLRPRQGGLRPRPGALRRLGGVHLHQPGQGARAVVARLPRADGDQDGELPVREADRALLLPRQRQEQLEALHGRLPGVLPRTDSPREAVAAGLVERSGAGGVRGARLQNRRPAPSGEHGRHPSLEPGREHGQAHGPR